MENSMEHQLIENLKRAISAKAKSDAFSLAIGGRCDFDREDQLYCDSVNLCTAFIQRYGEELLRMLAENEIQYAIKQKQADSMADGAHGTV